MEYLCKIHNQKKATLSSPICREDALGIAVVMGFASSSYMVLIGKWAHTTHIKLFYVK
jgi:hypothetical protein